jgi:hypothetical protein
MHGLGMALGLLLAWTAAAFVGCSKDETSSADTTAPAAVNDLTLSAVTAHSVTLTWSAPGDDGTVGTADAYDIRYSQTTITSGNWGSAHTVTAEPSPLPPGTPQQFVIGQLTPERRYHFALVTSDEAGNVSGLSNVPDTTTARLYRRLTVSPDGTSSYTTISAAIADAAENDTVFVNPGTYNEALVVEGKRFVLLGIDADQAIVQYEVTEASYPALTISGGAHVEIRRMRFVQPFIFCGPGLLVDGSTLILEDCVLARCGLGASSSDVTLRRCTIWRMPAMLCDALFPLVDLTGGTAVLEQNIVGLASQGIACGGGVQPEFHCNDVWGMTDPDYNYMGVPDPTGTNGNISEDPRFVDFYHEDFHLRDDSPCREGATSGCGRMGAYDWVQP